MKNYTIGDIHGAYKALIQCLDRSGFDYAKDTLICLGDIVDGWSETPQCIEEMLKIKNYIHVWGNHDWWCNMWFKRAWTSPVWELQGGNATKDSYINNPEFLVKHRDFFDRATPFYLINNTVFVHGGIPPHIVNRDLYDQELNDLMWDRDLLGRARIKHYKNSKFKYGGYDEIFIGHTSTSGINNDKPLKYCNIWNLDQGAGWDGKLTIMNIDTKEYWQSDNVLELYPNKRGRY